MKHWNGCCIQGVFGPCVDHCKLATFLGYYVRCSAAWSLGVHEASLPHCTQVSPSHMFWSHTLFWINGWTLIWLLGWLLCHWPKFLKHVYSRSTLMASSCIIVQVALSLIPVCQFWLQVRICCPNSSECASFYVLNMLTKCWLIILSPTACIFQKFLWK